MPVTETGIGYSDNTTVKLRQYRRWITMHMNITQPIIWRAHWADPAYWVFDITAGAGLYQNKETGQTYLGTPLIAMEAATRVGLLAQFVFIDRDSANCERLEQLTWNRPNVTIHCGDHNDILPQYHAWERKRYGWLFCDPTDCTFPWEALAAFGTHYPVLDFVFYVHTANYRRTVGRHHWPHLQQQLTNLPKKHWVVREQLPGDKHVTTFLIGSNWDSFPDWKREGFHRTSTAEGQAILDGVTYIKKKGSNGDAQLPLL